MRKVSAMTTPWPRDAVYLQLDDLIVDLRFRRVIDSGKSIELPQRIFELLLLFLCEPNKLHTRNELFDRLWAGMIVEDTNLSQSIWLLRKALGETRKSWIRTVAKSGYVFEPPAPLQWSKKLPLPATRPNEIEAACEPPDSPRPEFRPVGSDDSSVAIAPFEHKASETSAPQAQPQPLTSRIAASGSGTRRTYRTVVIAVLALACLAAVFAMRPWRTPAGDLQKSVAVVMIHGQNDSVLWAANLLEQWLSWKLDSLPEVNLLTEGDLAAGAGPASVDVVIVSAEQAPDNPDKIAVYARILKDGKEKRFEAKGEQADVSALVDSLSRQVVARLVPEQEHPWPALEVSVEAAKRYEQAANAHRHRDWMAVVSIGKEVMELSPRFGLMRLQLAIAQTNLYNAAAAKEQIGMALKLLAPAPPVVAAQLNAQNLAVDQLTEKEALDAYSSLVAKYPSKVAYQLEYARLLIAAGEPNRVLQRLEETSDYSEPASVRIIKDQLRADAYRLLGDPVRMRAVATSVEKLTETLGPAWTLERADATLSLALADHMQYPERGMPARYEQAATLFDQVGNSTKALYARYRAREFASDRDGPDPVMDELLAHARIGGYRRLEITALVASAGQHMDRANAAMSRSDLEKAYAIAQASGDLRSARQISVSLLRADLLSARFDDAASRADDLRKADLQTAASYLFAQHAARLAVIHGQYAQAIEILEREEKQQLTSPGRESSGTQTYLQCIRADILLTMGRLSDARRGFNKCSQVSYRGTRSIALLGESRAEWLAGNRQRADTLLNLAEKTPVADRWTHMIGIAALAIRLGDTHKADRIHTQLLTQLQASGYSTLIATIHTGQAESAAARRNWTQSRIYSAKARKLIQQNTWLLTSRLDLVAAVDARERGDMVRANAIATKLHSQAHKLGDAEMELQVHKLFKPGSIGDDCSISSREKLIALTGMRGADGNWLDSSGPGH